MYRGLSGPETGRKLARGFLTDDGAAFRDGNVTIYDDRRQPQRLNILQSLGSKFIRVPLPLDYLIRDFEFLLYVRLGGQYGTHAEYRQLAKHQRVATRSSGIVSD